MGGLIVAAKRFRDAGAQVVFALLAIAFLRPVARIRRGQRGYLDRLLKPVWEAGKQGRRRSSINTPLRRSVTVRTFNDWNDPPPGFFEMDMVAHSGKSVAGSHAHSLVLTDIASGWTEAAAMVVQTLITVTVEEIRESCHS